MTEYTPTTDHILSAWIEFREFKACPQERVAEFNRWLAQEINRRMD